MQPVCKYMCIVFAYLFIFLIKKSLKAKYTQNSLGIKIFVPFM